MNLRPVVLFSIALLTAMTARAADPVTLVRDINTAPWCGLTAQRLASTGDQIAFFATDGVNGEELWASDGTAEGTRVVRDIVLGSEDSAVGYKHTSWGRRSYGGGGYVYFIAREWYRGFQVWQSDLTPEGTKRVSNFDVDPWDPEPYVSIIGVTATGMAFFSGPGGLYSVRGGQVTALGNFPAGTILGESMYFGGGGLWRTDGTVDGTRQLISSAILHWPIVMGSVGDRVLAVDSDYILWSSDGTESGSIRIGSFGNVSVVYSGSSLSYFRVGAHLYRTDGTPAGTYFLCDVSSDQPAAILDDKLYFAGGPIGNVQPWISDGTVAGTGVLKAINVGKDAIPPLFTATASRVFFVGDDGVHGQELWVSDGTPDGTAIVSDASPGTASTFFYEIVPRGNEVLISGAPSGGHASIARSNGASLEFVFEFCRPSSGSGPGFRGSAGKAVLFSAFTPESGREIWRSDGTPEGTNLVRDINPGAGSSSPSNSPETSSAGGRVYFSASDGSANTLWSTDGISVDMVKQLTSYGSGFMAPAGERMVFAESSKLYSSSGSEATTSLIRDFAPASLGGTATTYGGEACFEVYSSTSPELWCTDGTSGGTRLVTARVPRFTAVSAFGRLFLVAGDAGLWVSDGTDAGTRKISTVRPSWAVGAGSGLLFFSSGKGLWRSDGTAAGTFPLRDFSEFCSNPFRPFVDGGVVTFFQADDGVHGCEPWQSDGTPGGTRMIADMAPGADNSTPFGWTDVLSFDGDFYFGATDIVHGYELWRLRDGVVSLLSDFWPGAGSGFNRFIGDEAPSLISASTPATGAELFRMDVTRKPGCSLFLTRPLAGESWGIGDQLIAWAQEGGDCSSLIAIDLLKGNDVVNSIATSVDAKAGWVRYLPDSSIIPGTDYRVRVHDVANPAYEATSSYFSINADSPCSITLLTPNGGENWMKGDPQTISWRSSGVDCSSAVRIDLLKGSSVFQSIKTHADAGSGSTTFTPLTVPDGADYFVRIQDELNSQFSDVSDAALTITSSPTPRCEIAVVHPNGGETWYQGDVWSQKGETVTVEWSLSGTACGSTVRVSLLKGSVEAAVIATGVDAANGTATYTVPNTLAAGTDYTVRVADTTDASVADSSDLPFTIVAPSKLCSLQLYSPNGADIWTKGVPQLVQWRTNCSQPVVLQLLKGSTVVANIDSPGFSTTTTEFTPPLSLADGNDYSVRVIQKTVPEIADSSDRTFSIVSPVPPVCTLTLLSPKAGDTWYRGQPQTIMWSSTGTGCGPTLNVELLNDRSGLVLTALTTQAPTSSNAFAWTPPADMTNDAYTMRVFDLKSGAISSSNFTITDVPDTTCKLGLYGPNGGEWWKKGESHWIQWWTNPYCGTSFSLFLLKGGSVVRTISATASGGLQSFTIPMTTSPGADYKVQIQSNASPQISDVSDAFVIYDPNFDPNGDSMIDPSDIFYLVSYLFTNGPAPSGTAGKMSGDANGDSVIDPADIFFVVSYLFTGGAVPHATQPGGAATASVPEALSGEIRLGQPVTRDGRFFAPVIVTMDRGSATPQAISLRVRFTGDVGDAVMHHAPELAPIFEVSRPTDDAIAYLAVFDQRAHLVLDNSRSAVIGEIEFTAGEAVRLEIDPTVTMLANIDGTRTATVGNNALRLTSTSIRANDLSTHVRVRNDE